MASTSSIRIPRRRKRLDIDEAIRLRKQERLSAAAIARKLGVTAEYLRAEFKRQGVSLRPARSMGEPHAERLRSLWQSIRYRCYQPKDNHPQWTQGARGMANAKTAIASPAPAQHLGDHAQAV